ncbi:uncharacterized protein G2W53_027182 [Senna tora]|uniref:Uncharacterized protein n=1 Tax=Senna tora TaxID=362788 RepID=A0A834TGG2_9FABA|nr:uncharacterized protein G2W53_027182 [Senna tora]
MKRTLSSYASSSQFPLSIRGSSFLPASPLFPPFTIGEETLFAAIIRFSAAAALSSRCNRRLLASGDSSGDPETTPETAASLGLLRLGSGGECCILIRIAICKSSSS